MCCPGIAMAEGGIATERSTRRRFRIHGIQVGVGFATVRR